VFRFVVLGLLRDGQPRHGYAVAKEYSRRSGLAMNTGSFYRELQRLAAEGLVRAVTNPPEADGRRAPYAITPAGKALFETWLSSTRDAWSPGYEDALSSRALFLGEAELPVIRGVLDRWSEALWSLVKSIEREREAVLHRTAQPQPVAPSPTLALLQARRLRHLAVELEFVDEFRAVHEQIAATVSPLPASDARAADPDAASSPPRRRRPSPEPPGAAMAALGQRGAAVRGVARAPR
jgi:DNA-binding PadR family transcriptional regulator